MALLRGSFRPADEICAIRSLWRHRDNLIEPATIHLQHMQKALDQMNVQLHHVISDLAGTTGLVIVDAILAGERDPAKLAQLRDWRIRASEETIVKSLVLRTSTRSFTRNWVQQCAAIAPFSPFANPLWCVPQATRSEVLVRNDCLVN